MTGKKSDTKKIKLIITINFIPLHHLDEERLMDSKIW